LGIILIIVNLTNKTCNLWSNTILFQISRVSKGKIYTQYNLNTLTIYNAALDYGTQGADADNFQILVFILNIKNMRKYY
jgi:hypothetical protein